MSTANANHAVWEDSFQENVRREQLADDSDAWRAVTGILLTIVSIGAALAVFTVWVCF